MQQKGLKRNPIDKFYTKPETVLLCINEITTNNFIKKDDYIIEPAAGNGAFINEIKKLSNNHLFFDIEPENDEIIQYDYIDYIDYIKIKNNIHIITNPPFGKNSSLAIKFIKKSCKFAKSISMILPKSFKKESMYKHFDPYFHLIKQINIPYNSFLLNNTEYNVPCIFQIWIKQNDKRLSIDKIIPINFEFVKKTDNPDISFRRVGANAGEISDQFKNKNIQSHYFIKFLNNKTIDENILLLKDIKFTHDNTVGPKSINKTELITEFNSLLQ